MTLLSAARSAILRAEGSNLTEVFASSEQVAREIADLSNEVAADIAKSHDWRALLRTVSAAGPVISLPGDYDRMSGDVIGPGGEVFHPFATVDDWQAADGARGWVIFGGALHFSFTPAGPVRLAYVSRNWARGEAGDEKPGFTQDDDEFVLEERLLTLGLIWRWKAQKGLEYSEDLASFDLALAQAQGRDKGPRTISIGGNLALGRPTLVIAGNGGPSDGTPFDFVSVYNGAKQ